MSSYFVESPASPPPQRAPPLSSRNDPWRCNAGMSSNSVEFATPPQSPPLLLATLQAVVICFYKSDP
jgi:hypothetical protein